MCKEKEKLATDKHICIFLVGFLIGMTVTMIMSLSMIERRINSLDSPFASIGYEVDILRTEIRDLGEPIQNYYNQAGTASIIMDDVIRIGREEVNDYNRTRGE